jgi:hypothetical protein
MMLPPKWMISAAHSKTVMNNGRPQMVPFGERHARAIGQVTTACAGSWSRCDQVIRDSASSTRSRGARPVEPVHAKVRRTVSSSYRTAPRTSVNRDSRLEG